MFFNCLNGKCQLDTQFLQPNYPILESLFSKMHI